MKDSVFLAMIPGGLFLGWFLLFFVEKANEFKLKLVGDLQKRGESITANVARIILSALIIAVASVIISVLPLSVLPNKKMFSLSYLEWCLIAYGVGALFRLPKFIAWVQNYKGQG